MTGKLPAPTEFVGSRAGGQEGLGTGGRGCAVSSSPIRCSKGGRKGALEADRD